MNFNCFIANVYHECTIAVPVPPKTRDDTGEWWTEPSFTGTHINNMSNFRSTVNDCELVTYTKIK